MNNNYYLHLLYKKVMELKQILDNIDSKNYTDEQKKYLISGYIITLDTILETGISDLHTPEMDKLTSLIYYTRQKAVHYGYFNGMHNIQEIAETIIDLTKENYYPEEEYFSSLFDASNFELKSDNIMIKNHPNIKESSAFFKFQSNDGTKKLWIPKSKVFTLTKQCKDKISNYIIDLDAIGSLYTNNHNESGTVYQEITGAEIEEFISKNYIVEEKNYDLHLKTIQKIITRFTQDPINSIQIMEYASDEQFCKNTIDVIKNFILERTMFDAYLQHYHLIKDKYSLNKMHKTDYNRLQNSFKKSILQYLTQKDAFFIETTIKRAKYYFGEILHNSPEDFEDTPEILSSILIQLFETGPKHFSNRFISSSPEFKKCYSNLLRYRQIFSHYLLNNKENKDAIIKFKNEFLGFINLLEMIDLNDVRIAIPENYETCSLLEKDKSDFFNYKHEQYLKIDSKTYIGKKIHYSSKNSESKTLIAIVPYGINASNTYYYKKDENGDLIQLYTQDSETGKRSPILVSKKSLEGAKEAKIDFNISNLFKAYSELKRIKPNGDILISFSPIKENEYYNHYESLNNVILRFYIQGYLPAELLQVTKLNTNQINQGIITLLDEKNNQIATIINSKKQSITNHAIKDRKGFFSRIDDINHSFNRRRNSKC